MKKTSILLVCTANICRSPIAHGLLRELIDLNGLNKTVAVDSAGTNIFHKGLAPDVRAQRVALEQGIDLSDLRSRNIRQEDFSTNDAILAMDNENYRVLQQLCPAEQIQKISLVMEYAPQLGVNEVPDPYFSNIAGFERVFGMLEVAMHGVVEQLRDDQESTYFGEPDEETD
jgi:protein-tyrosine phosphatase